MTRRHTVDRVLETAAAHVRYPATPDVVAAVMLRIGRLEAPPRPVDPGLVVEDAAPVSLRGLPPSRRSLRRRSVAAAAAMVVAAVVVVGAAFGAHDAVADWLGIGAVQIETVPLPDDLPGRLGLGDPVTLDEAREGASVEVLVPETLGDPDLVLLDDVGQVSLVYGLPVDADPAGGAGVGTLVTFLHGDFGPGLSKLVDSGITDIRRVDVAGTDGLWLEGGPHAVVRTDPTGNDVVVEGRLAANTLLWIRNGTTIRIETTADLATTLTIAQSLQPVR